MKKRILRTGAGLLFAVALMMPSCDILEDCGTCELVTEWDDGTVTRGTPLVYCGDAYYDKVNSSATSIAGGISYWDCY